jgi:hypothetical protein
MSLRRVLVCWRNVEPDLLGGRNTGSLLKRGGYRCIAARHLSTTIDVDASFGKALELRVNGCA